MNDPQWSKLGKPYVDPKDDLVLVPELRLSLEEWKEELGAFGIALLLIVVVVLFFYFFAVPWLDL